MDRVMFKPRLEIFLYENATPTSVQVQDVRQLLQYCQRPNINSTIMQIFIEETIHLIVFSQADLVELIS